MISPPGSSQRSPLKRVHAAERADDLHDEGSLGVPVGRTLDHLPHREVHVRDHDGQQQEVAVRRLVARRGLARWWRSRRRSRSPCCRRTCRRLRRHPRRRYRDGRRRRPSGSRHRRHRHRRTRRSSRARHRGRRSGRAGRRGGASRPAAVAAIAAVSVGAVGREAASPASRRPSRPAPPHRGPGAPSQFAMSPPALPPPPAAISIVLSGAAIAVPPPPCPPSFANGDGACRHGHPARSRRRRHGRHRIRPSTAASRGSARRGRRSRPHRDRPARALLPGSAERRRPRSPRRRQHRPVPRSRSRHSSRSTRAGWPRPGRA